MKFTKMSGAGNDFIIIDNMNCDFDPLRYSYIAKTLCKRRLSIGADGIMFVERAKEDGDYRMAFYNANGTMGEMCGNGARCIARYGYENGLAGAVQKIETTAGLVKGWKKDGNLYKIKLNDLTKLVLCHTVEIKGVAYEYSYVELGNPGVPHVVVKINGLKHEHKDGLRELGRSIRYHSAFPKGANVNFYDTDAEGEIIELTFERGVEDFTYACGTGAAAAAAVLSLTGEISGNCIMVHAPGGTLQVDIELTEGKIETIFLTGPTNLVAEGEVRDEKLIL